MRNSNAALAALLLGMSLACFADNNDFDASPWAAPAPNGQKSYPYKPSAFRRVGQLSEHWNVYAFDEDRELFAAAARNDYTAVEQFLKSGANPNAKDEGNYRPLMFAIDFGAIEITRILLDAGADPNVKKEGSTLLANAAMNGHARIARMLLDAGARVDERCDNAYTALMNAAFMNRLETAKVLLQYAPDLGLENDEGMTALAIAEARGNRAMADLLRRHGAQSHQAMHKQKLSIFWKTHSLEPSRWAFEE